MVTRVASLGSNYKSGDVFLAKIKSKESSKTKLDPLISEQVPNQMKDLNKTEAEVTLSTIHLLHNLLNKNFGFDSADISNMQHFIYS